MVTQGLPFGQISGEWNRFVIPKIKNNFSLEAREWCRLERSIGARMIRRVVLTQIHKNPANTDRETASLGRMEARIQRVMLRNTQFSSSEIWSSHRPRHKIEGRSGSKYVIAFLSAARRIKSTPGTNSMCDQCHPVCSARQLDFGMPIKFLRHQIS